jgi:hypothetical protein
MATATPSCQVVNNSREPTATTKGTSKQKGRRQQKGSEEHWNTTLVAEENSTAVGKAATADTLVIDSRDSSDEITSVRTQ